MGCCANCFGDSFLQKQIEEKFGTETGDCSYCGASNVLLATPTDFQDSFEQLIGIYYRGRGKILVNWLKADWRLFDNLSNAQANRLLSEILESEDIVRRQFQLSIPDDGSSLERWHEFRDELMHENRFFPKKVPDLVQLGKLLEGYLCAEAGCIPKTLYRARIIDGDQPHPHEEMGKPSQMQAANGRANPAGIPYLYLASDIDTAITEIRPNVGDNVCVSEFIMVPGLRVVDLRNPRTTVSPFFSLSNEDDISHLRKDIDFLCQLGEELTRPVLPKAAHIEYLPSQYLCEFIKDRGFDGVMYRSSVSVGSNFALFDKELKPVGNVRQYNIIRITVDKEEYRIDTSTVAT